MTCSALVSLPIDLKTLQKAELKHILQKPSPKGMNLEARWFEPAMRNILWVKMAVVPNSVSKYIPQPWLICDM